MKRLALSTAALLVALSPAVVGLLGNASFSGDIPVRVPTSAQVVDDESPSPTSTPAPSRTAAATPSPSRTLESAEPGDDRGGERPPGTSDDQPTSSATTRVGDDRGGLRGSSSTSAPSSSVDDRSGRSDHSGSDHS
ncbi:hypothetical protein V3N99_12425 [Dermatophilaceae bacterium Soc4.6]